MGTIFSRVELSGKHVAALLALMLLSAVTAMLLPTALASMIDIGVAGENRNTTLEAQGQVRYSLHPGNRTQPHSPETHSGCDGLHSAA